VSYNNTWDCVRTSTDRPCPTSITVATASPRDGKPRCGHSSGSHSSKASGLPGTPRGSNSQAAPASASGTANHAGSGKDQSASGLRAIHAKPGHGRSKASAARRHGHSPSPACKASSPVPANASGTTTRLHHGMAMMFAMGPASDACPNSITVSGSNPTVATACAPKKPPRCARQPCSPLPGRHHSSHATPPKLSQNPGASTDSGSATSITINASASVSAARCARRSRLASTTSQIISTVRIVGSANPATAA
jgi:hypothetical protein